MTEDRREQERHSLRLRTQVSLYHESGETMIDSVAANISSGGAFLITDHPFAMSARLKLEFQVSLDDLKKLRFLLSMDSLRQIRDPHFWITASGVVIRQESDGVGVIFDTNYQITPLNLGQSR